MYSFFVQLAATDSWTYFRTRWLFVRRNKSWIKLYRTACSTLRNYSRILRLSPEHPEEQALVFWWVKMAKWSCLLPQPSHKIDTPAATAVARVTATKNISAATAAASTVVPEQFQYHERRDITREVSLRGKRREILDDEMSMTLKPSNEMSKVRLKQ